jgi:hypothetical protein
MSDPPNVDRVLKVDQSSGCVFSRIASLARGTGVA